MILGLLNMFGSFVLFKSNIIIIDDLMIIFGSNIESNQSYAYLKIDFIKKKFKLFGPNKNNKFC